MHSYKNTSKGGREEKGFIEIKDFANPKPPPGASNSYEKVREKIDRKDMAHMHRDPYTKEKMANK